MSDHPEPIAEKPILKPGGPDALPDDPQDRGQPRDLDPERNPGVKDTLPDEIAADDDKQQEPSGQADEEANKEAGQVSEDGSPEPPA